MINTDRVLDALSALVWTAYPDGRLDFVNQWCIEYTGLRTDDGSRHLWRLAIHPHDVRPLLERWRSIRASCTPGTMETRIRRRDGQYHGFIIRVSPIRDDAGHIVQWCGVGQQIPDASRLEAGPRPETEVSQRRADSIAMPIAATASTRGLEYLGGSRASEVAHPGDPGEVNFGSVKAHRKRVRYNAMDHHPRTHDVHGGHGPHGLGLRDAQSQLWRWVYPQFDVQERQRTDIGLSRSEHRLQSIVSTIPTLAWSTGGGCSADFLSQHYLDYLGLSREQAREWTWQSAVHPEDLDALTARWTAVLESGQPGEAEARLRRHDGVYRWFLCRANPLRDATGKVVRWYGTNTDIDDLKRAERELRRSEALLGQAQRLTQTGSLWWRISTGELYLSDQGFRILEYPRTREPSLAMLLDRCHPNDIDLVRDAARRLVRDGGNVDIEFRLLMPGGTTKHIHVIAESICINPGESKLIAALTDITDRKRSAEALERSEAFLAEGQHLARIGNFSWYPLTGENEWSKPLYSIFEFNTDHPVTLDMIKSRLHPCDAHVHDDILARARRGDDHIQHEHRIVVPDQSVKHVHMVAHRSSSEAGELRYIGAIRDVTQERLAEEALRKVRAQLARVARVSSLSALTASIAHEVNQPLSGIITNASACLRMLDWEPPDMEGAREAARRTIRDGNRAAEVIVRLRDLFGNRAARFGHVDLNEAAREVMGLLRGEMDEACVTLRAEFADDLPLVSADRVQLQQVIVNLLRNAAEAMNAVDSSARLLTVGTAVGEDGQIHFVVRDTGIGFLAEEAGKIFDMFYTTKPDGMGVGLAVSRSIIESHNGHLWAAPNEVGQGAVFEFAIPSCPHIPSADTERGQFD